MASVGEPSDADVGFLCELTNLGRDEAVARLKANSLNVEQAVNEFFNNPDSSKYKWDESAWTADREGPTDSGIQFNIQGPDEHAPSYHNSAAPTRPPSRTNNRSPLGRLVDLTAFQAAGAPMTAADEDADLQRALAESAAESGVPPQETGVTGSGAHSPAFGPATRSEYEQDQWAMVPTKVEATQDKPLPTPSARKRDPASPAFVRSKDETLLGGVVTILHKIPKARNALLTSGQPVRSYGHNSEWWKGQPILKKESLEAIARNDWGADQDAHPDFHEELHRLIAFLDSSERSYGSVDGLADTTIVNPGHGYGWGVADLESNFFQGFLGENIENPHCEIKPFVFVARPARVLSKPPGEDHTGQPSPDTTMTNAGSDTSDDEQEAQFNFLSVTLEEGQNSWVHTLYDALDSIFWSNAVSEDSFPDEGSRTAVFTELGEILPIRISGSGLCQPCDIPEVLYLDRYVESRKDIAISIQTQIHKLRNLLDKRLKAWEKRILSCQGATGCRELKWFNGRDHSARECWDRSIKASESKIASQRMVAQLRYTQEQIAEGKIPSIKDLALIYSGESPYEFNEEEKEIEETLQQGIDVAKGELGDIDVKLEDVKLRREQCYHGLRHLSKYLTCREEEATPEFRDQYIVPDQPKFYKPEYWNPTHRYFLRGVATTSEITYVCVRKEADLIDLGDEPGSKDQWWRLVYAAKEANPISVEKTDAESVLIAAGTESKTPIMVYASEAAMKADPVQLSDALRMFVRADNRSFQHELSQEQAEPQSQAQQSSPTPATHGHGPVPLTAEAINSVSSVSFNSPSKRKHSISGSSVATVGSSDSRDMEMSFSDPPDPSNYRDDRVPSASQYGFASPASQPNKLGGLVESLENCRTNEPDSPVLGRRDLAKPLGDQEMRSFGPDETAAKGPEMQQRAVGPSPFVQRPVAKASQAAQVDLMDMDMEIETEHHEG
ncbi:hypothetical protein JX265_013352 [Neoarthrinium moseri]|uniref:Ubiquitin interaction domain-containing protein n=1 Tax=Neoarthrinium moseri TaxID=1658444 RepID=A0A9P9W8M4_9PEZI|nr:uncharacterized protein JN550_012212 [Neoarthrinium moseri]KAI1847227.1 hypothetical protein JX266_006767 [Neoarthrinium moseri]KAI1850789.1 hypothetical protein JX265_013352 [Neoarthrinium moseri]KAI1859199.1 hypothetical protein JN550_012212 [Neoarthrinium moseri]